MSASRKTGRTSDETLSTVYEKGLQNLARALGDVSADDVSRTGDHEPEHESRDREVAFDLAPGTVLGKYRIEAHLGAGGMGALYEAVHVDIGKAVALKTLSRRLAAEPKAQARFLREAKAASRLDHPHVVNVTDFGSQDDVAFLVMELLRGEDLAARIDRHPNGLPTTEAIDILLAVSAGVHAAHQVGVIHRDLKARNIFLAKKLGEIEPKVLDFGISKVDDLGGHTNLTASGALLGTVPYMAPEHIRGGLPDARSDQYALGVVLYETLTGRKPHEGATAYALMEAIVGGAIRAPRGFAARLAARARGGGHASDECRAGAQVRQRLRICARAFAIRLGPAKGGLRRVLRCGVLGQRRAASTGGGINA